MQKKNNNAKKKKKINDRGKNNGSIYSPPHIMMEGDTRPF